MRRRHGLSFTLTNVASELIAMLAGMLFVTFLSLAYRHFAPALESKALP